MNTDAMTAAERLALWDTHDRPERWSSGNEHHLADLIIRDLRALSTPPADDVREALAMTLFRREHDKAPNRWIEAAWAVLSNRDEYLLAADAILAAFEVRPHGTVTPSFDAWRALIERVQADWPNVRVPGTTWQMTPQQAEASDRAQARRCAELAEADSRFRATLTGYLDLRTVARVMADLEAAREVRSDV